MRTKTDFFRLNQILFALLIVWNNINARKKNGYEQKFAYYF